jgi:multidrug resistance efflux pump
MNEAATEYDDLLDDGGHPWRRRLITSAVLLTLLVAGVLTLWMTVLRGGGSAANVTQTAKVTRGNISKTVSTSASTVSQSTANLSFSASGRVTAVNVKISQEVKQGDVLAEVQSDSLQNAVSTAQISLANAQAKLNTLLQGSTASQLTSADQSVVQAQTSYDQAVQALQDLYNAPTASALSAAQQSVTQAQSQVTQAQNARTKLDTTSSDAVTAAKAAVEKARSALDSAERAATNAALDSEAACPTPQPTPPDSACRAALAKKDDADAAVNLAEDNLATAKDNLATAKDGPTAEDIASAEAAIVSAQQGLQTANDKLAELTAGPTDEAVQQAQDKVSTAAAGLSAAQAKRDEVYAGSTAADIQAQQSQVQLATLSLAQAKKGLEGAQIIAPFDGAVAALNINVGDTVGTSSSSSSSSTTAAIVLNTPNAIILNLSIGESDLPNVKAGESGTATFDAIAGTVFPIVIDSVGTNPTTTQGVVTYQARAHIVAGQGARQAAGGFTGRSRTPSAGQTPQAQGTPNAAPNAAPNATPNATATAAATPVPGMNATVTIITAQSQNVLVVLTAAIQRDGTNSVVTIQNDDGSTARQVVETGLSDGANTEITDGLQEGQTVIIPSVTAASNTSSQTTPATGGNRFFGGAGGAPEGPGIRIGGD